MRKHILIWCYPNYRCKISADRFQIHPTFKDKHNTPNAYNKIHFANLLAFLLGLMALWYSTSQAAGI
jgi:hypothetical protein